MPRSHGPSGAGGVPYLLMLCTACVLDGARGSLAGAPRATQSAASERAPAVYTAGGTVHVRAGVLPGGDVCLESNVTEWCLADMASHASAVAGRLSACCDAGRALAEDHNATTQRLTAAEADLSAAAAGLLAARADIDTAHADIADLRADAAANATALRADAFANVTALRADAFANVTDVRASVAAVGANVTVVGAAAADAREVADAADARGLRIMASLTPEPLPGVDLTGTAWAGFSAQVAAAVDRDLYVLSCRTSLSFNLACVV